MNVVDSSGWLEYFAGTPRADFFSDCIEDIGHLIVPSITLYEVFKKVSAEKGVDAALQVIAHMRQGRVVSLDADLCIEAARLNSRLKIPMAGSMILATALRYHATLWTQDSDFSGVEGVRYFLK